MVLSPMTLSKIHAVFALGFSLALTVRLPALQEDDSGPAPPFEGLFHDGAVLMNSPHQLDESFSSRHRKEGFLEDDLRDFIAWLEENTISPNPALMSLRERKAFLVRYLDFMEGPAQDADPVSRFVVYLPVPQAGCRGRVAGFAGRTRFAAGSAGRFPAGSRIAPA